MTLEKYLAAVRQRLEKATPGPWRAINELNVVTSQSHPLCTISNPFHRQCTDGENIYVGKDALLIANTPTDLTTLIEIVETLWEALHFYSLHVVGAPDAGDHARFVLAECDKIVSGK